MMQTQHYANKLNYEIDAWDLSIALRNNENIIVIDARSSHAYETEHIPNAISLPHRNMNAENTLHFNQSALIITYCDGIGCNASTKGALAMSLLGFKVKELIGGLDWWKRDGHLTLSNTEITQQKTSCGCD
jgi:rhodanese-related sulfurtransferase